MGASDENYLNNALAIVKQLLHFVEWEVSSLSLQCLTLNPPLIPAHENPAIPIIRLR